MEDTKVELILDWPELFLLKNDHCRFVVSREKELRRMRKQNPIPSEATLLERDIVDNYRCYQRALEQVMVVDELYTKLGKGFFEWVLKQKFFRNTFFLEMT